jgi:hypothetical protein
MFGRAFPRANGNGAQLLNARICRFHQKRAFSNLIRRPFLTKPPRPTFTSQFKHLLDIQKLHGA